MDARSFHELYLWAPVRYKVMGMSARMKSGIARVCVALWLTGLATGSAALEVTELMSGVYLHQGRHETLESAHRDDIANVGFVVGERCVAVIDSGGSIAAGERLRKTIREHTKLPICYVINTHVHFDHVLGNQAFIADEAVVVGHRNLKGALAASRDFFRERFAEELGLTDPARLPDELVPEPGRLVEDQLELDLGGRTLLLRAWPAAHTDNDLTVLDTASGILWTGDLLFRERVPVFDASLKGWLAVMEELGRIEATQFVPGHGAPAPDWKSAAAAQRAYLQLLLEDTRAWIARGGFMEEVLEAAQSASGKDWLLFDEYHSRNVSKAFIELEWE